MITSIKLQNITVNNENGYYLTSLRGTGYTTKYPTATVAQYHGVKIGNSYYNNRVLEIGIKIVGSSVSDYIEKRKALFGELAINEYGHDQHILEITLSNGVVLEARGLTQSLADEINSTAVTAGDCIFTFEMEEPFFKSKQQYQHDIYITKGGGGAIPMAVPFDMSAGSSGYSEVSQIGNVFCFPEIYFYGELTNPVLTNVTLGKNISITDAIGVGEYYYVDTYNHIVNDDTGANKRDKMTGEFLVIATGTNQYSLSTDDALETGYVRLIYKDFYISI